MGQSIQVDILAEQLRQQCPELLEAERLQLVAAEERRVSEVLAIVANSGRSPESGYDVALCGIRGLVSFGYERKAGRPGDKPEKVFLIAGMVDAEEQRGRSRPEAVRRTAQLLDLTDDQVDKAPRKTLAALDRWFPDLTEAQRETLDCDLSTRAQSFVVTKVAIVEPAEIGAEFRRGEAA